MRWIAHRGNTEGPIPERENTPDYLVKALERGYDIEVDVWMGPCGLLCGHERDGAVSVSTDFLRRQNAWVHCKDVASFMCLSRYPDVNCFMQDAEPAVLTSRGFVWLHSSYDGIPDGRCVLTQLNHQGFPAQFQPYAVCTDWVGTLVPERPTPPFKLLVVDIDGVMTKGKLYDPRGVVIAKEYCDLDFTAIKRFRSAGINVVFMSGDKTVNEGMANTRQIQFIFAPPGSDKATALRLLAKRSGLDITEIAYVGDDYYDISAMATAGMSFCPSTSPNAVKRAATCVVVAQAGQGVLASVYDRIEPEICNVYPEDSPSVNPQ